MKCEEGFRETPERKPSCYGYIPVRPRAPRGMLGGNGSSWKENPGNEWSILSEQFGQGFW